MLLTGVKQATGLLSSSSTRRVAAIVCPHISSMHTPERYSTTPMGVDSDTLGATAETAAGVKEAAAAGQAVDAAAEPAAKKVKRNVALHIGYVGTGYTGTSAAQQDNFSQATADTLPAAASTCQQHLAMYWLNPTPPSAAAKLHEKLHIQAIQYNCTALT
jgi:hypothetical protein